MSRYGVDNLNMVAVLERAMQETNPGKTSDTTEGYSYRVQLGQILQNINDLRCRLGVTHEEVAHFLQISMGTYNKHKSQGFRTFSVKKIDRIFLFLQNREQRNGFVQNPRVQNHHMNLAYASGDDYADDGNNGDWGDDDE